VVVVSPQSVRVSGQIARWGFFVIALVLGTALLVSSITSYLGARTLLEAVIRDQAQSLHRALVQELGQREPPGAPDPARLQAFVDEHAAEGLRRVLLAAPEGRTVAAAGTGETTPLLLPDEIRVRGDLVQAAFVMGPPHPREGKRPSEGKRPPLFGRAGSGPPGPGFRHPPPIVSIEFVPKAALALRARSQRDLGVGLTVAMALMLGAAVFWRLSRRAQMAMARLATQRHLAALGEMSAVLAHEIRNPLASLKGHAQLLAERVEGQAALERKVERIVDETQRLEALTLGLLDFARTGGIERSEVDPVALLRRRAEGCASLVEVDDAQAPPSWRVDGPKLEQVLDNLLDNARQAAEADVPIEAKVYSRGHSLVFEVRDHGPGVPKDQRERIFDPFHTTRTRGTGLGLAVSRRIVELHGGTIEVLDAEGGGACFRVILPQGDAP